MGLPTQNDVQAVDPILTNLLVGYMQADDRFVASRAFPAVPVEKDSGTYFIFTKKYWFLDELKPRAAGDPFAQGGYGIESTTFATLQYGLEHKIPIEVRANSQVPMSLEEAGLRWLAQQSLIRKERAFAADFMKTSVWGTDDDNSTTDWDDYASGDPVADVLTARKTISNATGYDGNTLIVGLDVHHAILNHPDVIDRMKYTNVASVANLAGMVGAMFGLANYLVCSASYNSVNEGQSGTYAGIVANDALVCHTSPTPGILVPSAGYTFAWEGGGGMGAIGQYFAPDRRADILQHIEQWDQKAVATDLGYFFNTVI